MRDKVATRVYGAGREINKNFPPERRRQASTSMRGGRSS